MIEKEYKVLFVLFFESRNLERYSKRVGRMVILIFLSNKVEFIYGLGVLIF